MKRYFNLSTVVTIRTSGTVMLLASSGQHSSCDDYERSLEPFSAVLCTATVHNQKHIRASIASYSATERQGFPISSLAFRVLCVFFSTEIGLFRGYFFYLWRVFHRGCWELVVSYTWLLQNLVSSMTWYVSRHKTPLTCSLTHSQEQTYNMQDVTETADKHRATKCVQ